MKNWPYFYGNLGLQGIKSYIQFNPKTINIRILEVYGRDPHEDDQEANRQLMEIKAYLEDKYPRLDFCFRRNDTLHSICYRVLGYMCSSSMFTLSKVLT